jgi:hypothetical protein
MMSDTETMGRSFDEGLAAGLRAVLRLCPHGFVYVRTVELVGRRIVEEVRVPAPILTVPA